MIRRSDEALPHRLGPADARQKKERSGAAVFLPPNWSGGFLTADFLEVSETGGS